MDQILQGLINHKLSKYFLLAMGIILIAFSFILPVIQLPETLSKEMYLNHSALSVLNKFSRDLPVAIIVSFLFYPYIFVVTFLFFSIPFINKISNTILTSIDGVKNKHIVFKVLIGLLQFLISFFVHFLPIAVNFFYFYMFYYISPHYGSFYIIFGVVVTILYFLTYYYFFRYKNVQDKYCSKAIYMALIYGISSLELFLLLTVKLSYDIRTIVSVGAYTGLIGAVFFFLGLLLLVFQAKKKQPEDFNNLDMEEKKKKPDFITKKSKESVSNEG